MSTNIKVPYSPLMGVYKTIKNGLLILGPAIIAGVLQFINVLPLEIQAAYALPIGLIVYFIKNYIENK